ncbi:hypothetical protein [Apilactobacillus quenuiae]|uniref:hypothetical protein n=1 Tax=Apilactobacillus quenuiae TaxID=2008377 RepID=UPI000D017FAA|nr:hypothetical protein [Apilactobacillus quenuiae]
MVYIVIIIKENEYLNLVQLDFITQQMPPFAVQTKDNLVYCDLIEHLLLHVLITKESNVKFGYPGLAVFLVARTIDWYIKDLVTPRNWERNCYNKSYLKKDEVKKLINCVHDFLE